MTSYPDPGPLPRADNYTYQGHTSKLIPTPWPYEGRKTVGLSPDQVRFPKKKNSTLRKELERLAAIENPGLCRARRRHTDAWCHNRPVPGRHTCRWHAPGPQRGQRRVRLTERAKGQATLEQERAATKAAEIVRKAQRLD